MLWMTPDFCQPWMVKCVSTCFKFSDSHRNYPGQGCAKLKHNETYHSNTWRGQFPSWLAHGLPKYFTAPSHHPYTRSQCPVSQVPKYSELLISHRGSLRSKGHLYPYPSRDYSLAEERIANGHCSVWRTIHPPVCHASVIPWHSLVKRTTNQHNIQWPTLDISSSWVTDISFGREHV